MTNWRNLITCSACGESYHAAFLQLIDFGEDPSLQEALLRGEVNLLTCPYCGTQATTDFFAVHDPGAGRMLFFVPGGGSDVVTIKVLHNLLAAYYDEQQPYFQYPTIVAGWNELMPLLSGATSEAPPLFRELVMLLAAPSWKEKEKVLLENPELLGDESLLMLGNWLRRGIREASDPYAIAEKLTQPITIGHFIAEDNQIEPIEMELIQILFNRMMLEECQAFGIRKTLANFDKKFQMQGMDDEGNVRVNLQGDSETIAEVVEKWNWVDLMTLKNAAGEDPEKLPELITLCDQALAWPEALQIGVLKAEIFQILGVAYHTAEQWNTVWRLHQAKNYLEEALKLIRPDEQPLLYANVQNELGLVLHELPTGDRRENIARAIGHFQEALRYRPAGEQPYAYASTQHNLGMAISNRTAAPSPQDLEQAIQHFQEALRIFDPGQYPEEYAKTTNSLGTVFLEFEDQDARHLSDAVHYLQDALSVAASDRLLRVRLLNNLGQAYRRMGLSGREEAFPKAISFFQELLESLDENHRHFLVLAQEGLANTYAAWKGDDSEEAIRHYGQAMSYLMPETNVINEFPSDIRRIGMNLGNAYLMRSEWGAAVAAYREAIVASETLYRITATDSSRRNELSQTSSLYRNMAYAIAKLERYSEAAAHLEFGRTRIMGEALALFRIPEEQLDEEERAELKAAQRRVKKLEKEVRDLKLRPGDLSEELFLSDYSAELRIARRHLRAIMEQVELPIREMDVAGISAVATTDAPLVYLITTPKGSLAIIVSAAAATLHTDDVVWFDEFCETDLHNLLLNERNGYLWGQIRGDVPLLKRALDHSLPLLSSRLMKPLNDRLIEKEYRRATLISGGLLGLLPLPVAVPDPITYGVAPSASSLGNARERIQEHRSRMPSLAAIGNPLPGSNAPLPQARLEVEQISRYFPPDKRGILLETEATLANVLRVVAGKSYLHFSCHGTFNIDDPLQSSLFLSGADRLTLKDLLDGKADLTAAKIAVLSACQTGMIDFQHTPDEVIGMTAGFLQAGVPAVISALWAVDDLSTMLLMERFYQHHLQDDMPAVAALRQAQLWLRDVTAGELYERFDAESEALINRFRMSAVQKAEERPFNHPFYWAAFTFSGV